MKSTEDGPKGVAMVLKEGSLDRRGRTRRQKREQEEDVEGSDIRSRKWVGLWFTLSTQTEETR